MAEINNAGDYLARACFPKPTVDQAIAIKYLENGKPVVYKRRWAILVAFCFSYFTWNFHAYRTLPLISEYALFYNQPNEFGAPPNLGIDFIQIIDGILLIIFYPLGGKLVDTYGTQMMIYGSIGQAISCWWWYFSFESYFSVLFSKVLANLSGGCVASALLRVSNNWFGEDQRALAVAIGSLFSSFGGGAALIVAPFFSTGGPEIELDLLSCDQTELNVAGFNLTEAIQNEECPDFAEEAFCCASPTNINALNFFMAAWATAVAIYTAIVTKDAPPTPPSKAGIVRKGPSFKQALSIMFSKWNYVQICITDFVSSGPPLVLFSTVDRIFPATVSDYASLTTSLSFFLAIPAGAYFSFRLARTQEFYELTAAGYVGGFIAWTMVTLLTFIGTDVADVLVMVTGGLAIIAMVLWTVAVYELKIEYVFSSEYAIQGYVVAIDRTIINLSALIFLAAIPPERYKGDAIEGREFTFLVGMIFMLIGVILVLTIKDKRAYLRKQYEEENNVTVAEVLDSNIVYTKPDEEKVKTLLGSKIGSRTSKLGSVMSKLIGSKGDNDDDIAKYTL